jgi:Flp pilus assembly protein TadD
VAQKERKTFQARIERLGGKGDFEGAIAASLEHLEKEPEDWSALLGLGALYFRGGRDEEAIACYTRVADHYQTVVPDAPSRPAAARSTRRTPARGRTSGRAGGEPAKPLQTIFNELRARARDTDDATIAHERFDLAQYHLRDGNEDAAMTELREAVKAPVLRFTAAAQLGR